MTPSITPRSLRRRRGNNSEHLSQLCSPSPLEVKANARSAFVRGGGSDCAAIAGAAPFGLASALASGVEATPL
jgi:hypothetical protein